MRSSWLAVATKARRASSWRTSACCIDASARARSPTSSAPSSRGGGGALTPSRASASAVRRNRPRRRDSPVDSAIPSSSATPSPMTAAVRNALRTTSTALPPGSDLRTTRTRTAASGARLSLGALGVRRIATATPLPSFDALARVWPDTTTLQRSSTLGSVIPPKGYTLVGVALNSPTRASVRCASVARISLTSRVGGPAAARQRGLQRGPRRQRGRLDRGAALLVQPVLQRRQQRQRRDAERHHARRQQGQQQAGAEASPAFGVLTGPGTGSRRRAP